MGGRAQHTLGHRAYMGDIPVHLGAMAVFITLGGLPNRPLSLLADNDEHAHWCVGGTTWAA